MQLVENVLGNSNDPAWKARLADATIDTLELSQWDAQKNRLRQGYPQWASHRGIP